MPTLWDPLRTLPPVPTPTRMRAAVLVPLYEDRGRLRLVLTRRPDHMPTHPGDVVFPGGMIEAGDAGPVETAIREAHEEIGLPPDNVVEIFGGLRPTHTRSEEMLIIPVVARIERPERFAPEPAEVEAIIEPAIDELLPDANWRRSEWSEGRTMWFFEFPEGILWGATAYMVRELLELFRR